MIDDIEKLRAQYNLVDLVRLAGADPRHAYGEYRCACPLHKGDNVNGFAIYENNGRWFWRCFSGDCGGGDEFDFMAKRDNLTFKALMEQIKTGQIQPAAEPTQAEILRRIQELERKQAEQEKRLTEIEKWKKAELWKQYHENAPEWARAAWAQAGVPDEWQSFWQLGGYSDFEYTSGDGQRYHTPTMTIPVFAPRYETVTTVRHRLMKPASPADKYRPDIVGLGSHPFLCDPDLGYGAAGMTIVTEGEKKAMVTFLTYDKPAVQVIGIPGKGIWLEVAEQIKGQNIVIILDPDAGKQAEQMARNVGGARVVKFHHKIDDAIVKYDCDRDWIDRLINTARFVK